MYYRLTYKSSWKGHRSGDSILCSKRPLDIGQTDTCDLILPESERYEPTLFVTIIPLESGGWCIVRRTDCFSFFVNGKPLLTPVRLQDGDILTFAGFDNQIQLTFNVCKDGNFDEASGMVYSHKSRRHVFLLSTLLALFAVVLACFAIVSNRNSVGIHGINLEEYETSLYRIVTDSVVLVCDTVIDGFPSEFVLERLPLSTPILATCFLTDDGRFVTARHCVEPWVADESWDGVSLMTMPTEVSLAVRAETANRLGDRRFRVRTHCTISRDGEEYNFVSDDFKINRNRDLLIQLGSTEQPQWLRTIIPIASRRDMELSDFAYVDAPGIKGTFAVADFDDLRRFNLQTNRDIAIMGFPQKESNQLTSTLTFGNCQQLAIDSATSSIPSCIQISAPINLGNSGGPILALIGNRIKVVGIVSKVDIYASQATFWAVPATELVPFVDHQANDSNIYIR